MTARVALWRSLRLRLPLLMSSLIGLVFGIFLWMNGRELEKSLLREGHERARSAADQVSAMMAQGAARGVNEVRRVASDPALLRFLADPSIDPAEARALLTPLAVASQPPVELRSAGGALLLEAAPARGNAVPFDAAISLHPGLTPFYVHNDTVFYALIAEVTAPAAVPDPKSKSAGPALGYVVVRRTLTTAQTTDALNKLVGNGALVAIGHRTDGIWTNFSKP